MPELPEVETVRRGLVSVWEGERIARVIVRNRSLRLPIPADFGARLECRIILSVRRRAKYLLIDLSDGVVLVIHLGMSGRMVIGVPITTGPHDHVEIHVDSGSIVTYSDPRRFGLMALVPSGEIAAHPLFRNLGPEPLDVNFTGEVLASRLAGRRISVKSALLDQRVVTGLGNIYVCESLYRAGIAPNRLAGTVDGECAFDLVAAIKSVLVEAIAAGGSSLRDHRQPSGEIGYFQQSLTVYGREGKPCPGCDCGGGVLRMTQAGRSTFYCAKKQG